MKVGLSTLSLVTYPLETIFRWAAELGLDGLELAVTPEVRLLGAAHIRSLSRSHGVPVVAVYPSLYPIRGFEPLRRYYPKLLLLAEELEARAVTIHPFAVPAARPDAAERFWELLEPYKRLARMRGVDLALENRAFAPWSSRLTWFGDSLDQFVAFARAHDVRVTLDSAHAASGGWGLSEPVRELADRISHVHFSDLVERTLPHVGLLVSVLSHHQVPGVGTLDLKGMLDTLAAVDYDGFVNLELSPVALGMWRHQRAFGQLQHSVALVRGWIADCEMGRTPSDATTPANVMADQRE